MALISEQEVDSLGTLEDRIRQAIELVARLRREKDAALADRQAALAERDAALRDQAGTRERIADLTQEIDALRAERAQVRSRIEKLLSQIDSLGAG